MRKPTAKALKVLESGDFYPAIRIDEEEFSCSDFSDPMFFIHEVKGRVVLSGFGGEMLAEVGTFTVKLVDAEGALCQGVDVYTTFDMYQETWQFFEALVDGPVPWRFKDRVLKALGCEFDVLPLSIVIFTRLEIYPEYRGRDYGLAGMKCMMQRFRMGAGLFVMKPFPLQFEAIEPEQSEARGLNRYSKDQRASTRKLREHYARLGFVHIPRTPFMALAAIYPWGNDDIDVEWASDR